MRMRLPTWGRLRASIVLAVGVGALTGLGVTVLHLVVQELAWGPLSRRSSYWIAGLPLLGLLVASALVRLTPDRWTETTEDYVRTFHDPDAHLNLRSAPLRLLASVATISLGGSMGLEGPSIYLGALVGDVAERRFRRFLAAEDAKVMLVAGAAAGIAAIFKAPVTGIMFALEVPYRDDLARHALIPAVFAAATSYLVFVATVGTAPFFQVAAAPLRLVDLLGSLLVGLGCGIGARLFLAAYRAAGEALRRLPFWARPVLGGLVLGSLGALAIAVYHLPLPLGPGYNGILRAARGQIGPSLLLLLLAMKILTTSATAAGGGVGGLFFPSVMMGAAAGGALGHLVPGPASLFAVVGIAAFLGGAYKVPLAGVAFVAETTGAPGYIIPGLLAAAVAYLVSGHSSISARQRFRRPSQIESRLDISVSEAMSREWVEVPPEATVREFASRYVVLARSKLVPVARAGQYLGMASLDALRELPADRWDETQVRSITRTDLPAARVGWRLPEALRAMREQGVERLAVLNGDRIVGIIGSAEILRLGEVLDALSERERRGLQH